MCGQTVDVIENDKSQIFSDEVSHIKPQIVIIDKEARTCIIIDPACPDEEGVEKEKEENYDSLKWLVYKLWSMKREEVTSIVVGVLGTIGSELLIVTRAVKIGHLQNITLL